MVGSGVAARHPGQGPGQVHSNAIPNPANPRGTNLRHPFRLQQELGGRPMPAQTPPQLHVHQKRPAQSLAGKGGTAMS